MFFTLLGTTKAQQSNHLVVQGYMEHLDTRVEPYGEAFKKTVYYDIDFSHPDVKVNTIISPRIDYIHYYNSLIISQGYHTISNSQSELIAFVFNNILYNKNGDSIDYISQIGGKRGVASIIGLSDTFKLYYIQSANEFNAKSFERTYYGARKFNSYLDTYILMESVYFRDKIVSKKRIKGFQQYGDPKLLQSNVIAISSKPDEFRLQFVWNQNLYDINISNNYEQKKIKILNHGIIKRDYWTWYEYELQPPITELVLSPSGRWTIFNWAYDHLENNETKFSVHKVFLIDNKKNLDFKEILSDSGNRIKEKIVIWKNAVFTKYDSVFLIPEIINKSLNQSLNFERRFLEVTIQEKSTKIKSIDIQFPAIYDNKVFPIIKDMILAPNGDNYAFLRQFKYQKNAEGKLMLFRQFEIAKLRKNETGFYIENPIKVLEGVYIGNKTITSDGHDKIFFPATPIPYHYINFTNKSICNDLTHEFTNETDTNWFDHFMWFWGDGDSTASHKSQPIVRHQYPKPGKYRVNLKSITAHGGWVWYSDSVEVLPEPIAKYQTKNTVGCQWIAVRFNDSSVLQKKNHTWYWDFGDGTDTILQSSNVIMPTQKRIEHTYSSSGKFNVQLRITDGRCTDTFSTTQNIDILPAPRPGISIDKTTGCTPLEVRFARTYSDQTDSTIYHFKPALNPKNRFNGSQNTAVISKSGPYLLHQKLYGPSGCVTEDSVSLQITQGILPNTKPHLKRSTVVNNRTVLTEWNAVPHAKDYQVYRNGQPHAVANDTQFIDYLNRDIDRIYIYEIIAKDSCGNLASAKSNIGKPILLQVKQIEPASKSEFATALLTWTPYEDWSNSGGVENYSIFGNYAIESQSWQLLKNQTDTQLHDPDFIAPPNFEKCYRINAKSLDGRYQTQSNVACLDFPATLFAPNSFTPNGDGLNDAFEIFNYGFDRFTMTIYNSWGQKVFDQNGPTATWYPSKDIPQGVYVYQIKAVRNEKEFNFSGTVSLLR